MCSALVERKVWRRGRAAPWRASQARSMSRRAARASPATLEVLTTLATSRTASKSPFDAMGKPASMTSTCISSRSCATRSFSSRFIEQPGDCSPSRSVVSNTTTRCELLVTAWALRSEHDASALRSLPPERPDRIRDGTQGRISRSAAPARRSRRDRRPIARKGSGTAWRTPRAGSLAQLPSIRVARLTLA